MENGACGEQLMAFMECAMRTQCFKSGFLMFCKNYEDQTLLSCANFAKLNSIKSSSLNGRKILQMNK